MIAIFNIAKGIFFGLTIFIGLFALRGEYIIQANVYDVLIKILLPAYMVFAGFMLGYVIGYVLSLKKEGKDEENSYKTGFIIGGILGVAMAIVYFFLK